ncbi:hypothetical protein MMC17_005498 [Xylographa soralifera]|nr:hypothetical protein [Xylographa soralifera]
MAVTLRFRLRGTQKLHIKLDDWMMLPSVALLIGICIIAITGVKRKVWGYATPYEEAVSDPDAFNSDSVYEGRLLFAFIFVQIPTLGCIKLAALLFYRRVFYVQSGKLVTFNVLIRIFIGVTILWTIAMIMMNCFQCGINISALWTDPAAYDEYCGYSFPFNIGFAVSNFLLDFLIILLPIPKIWSLHMQTSRKIAVTGVFGLVSVGFAGSIARMVSYLQITANGISAAADFRLEDTEAVFWSNLEAGLSLLAINLPSLWVYISKISPERILASLRSMISLTSLQLGRSSRRSRSHTQIADSDIAAISISSRTKIAADHQSTENYIVSNVELKEVVPTVSSDTARTEHMV